MTAWRRSWLRSRQDSNLRPRGLPSVGRGRIADERLELVDMRTDRPKRRDRLRLRRRFTCPLHIGLDQLSEPNARRRCAAQLAERRPRCIVDRHASDPSANGGSLLAPARTRRRGDCDRDRFMPLERLRATLIAARRCASHANQRGVVPWRRSRSTCSTHAVPHFILEALEA